MDSVACNGSGRYDRLATRPEWSPMSVDIAAGDPDPATVVLVIAERARRDGRYSAHHDGRLVVEGVKEPFLDAARVLLAQGLDPSSRYVMRRSPDGPDALVSTLGAAARLTVRENDHTGPVFCPWKPYGGPT